MTHVVGYLPDGEGGLVHGYVDIEGDSIVGVGPTHGSGDAAAHDVGDHIILPGFIDLQLNGCFGRDFTTAPTSIAEVGVELAAQGVTAFLPTVITSPAPTRRQAYEVMRRASSDGGAVPLGLHIEGPFLHPGHAGTHPRQYLSSDGQSLVAELTEAADVVAMVTLAPELDGALEAIAALTGAGVVVAAGHSGATASQARQAFGAGVRCLTHTFNGMTPLHHREVGLLGASMLANDVITTVIADGHHVTDDALTLLWRLVGPDRICLVTDAMAAMGAPPGTYRIGDVEVECDVTARNRDGGLAGSLVSMPQSVRHLRAVVDATWDDIAAVTSATPAHLLGDSARGRLEVGCRADLVVVDHDAQPVSTWVAGRPVGTEPKIMVREVPPSGVVVGVDIGGTSAKVAALTHDGLGAVQRVATGAGSDPSAVVERIAGAVASVVAPGAVVSAVGVACTGVVDSRSGRVVRAANLGWEDYPLTDHLSTAIGVECLLDHDVFLGGLAEWHRGAGRGASSMMYVSVGTGVSGKLFDDASGGPHVVRRQAGELGYLPYGDGGLRLEEVASARAIERRYRERAGRVVSAAELVTTLGQDPIADEVWGEALDALAVGITAAVCLDDPALVVIGGGLSGAGEVILDGLRTRVADLNPSYREPVPVEVAEHGPDSGVVGAAMIAQDHVAARRAGGRGAQAFGGRTPIVRSTLA